MYKDLKILVAGLSKLGMDEKYKVHEHPYFQLNHIVAGKYEYVIEGLTYIAVPGDTILIPLNYKHSIRQLAPEGGYYFEVKFTSFMQNVKEVCELIPVHNEEDELTDQIWKEIFDEKNNAVSESDEIICMYLCSILFKLSSKGRREKNIPSKYISVAEFSEPVREAIRYLENHYREQLTLDDISLKTGVTKSYLCSLFKKETNLTVFECLMIIRIRKAVELLTFDIKSLVQISQETGFINPTHFNRVFSKHVMIPPGQYRKYLNTQHAFWNDVEKNPIVAAIYEGRKIDVQSFSNQEAGILDRVDQIKDDESETLINEQFT